MPTQKAASSCPEPHFDVGWTQLPETFENCVLPSELPATYPAQFWLT